MRPVLASLALASVFAGVAAADQEESDEIVLREAEKVERSMIRLVEKIRESTVAVIRYEEKEINGEMVEVESGQGSGVIVSRDGKVFTNVHVVANASRIQVVLPGGEPVEAELFSSVPLYDFALLKIRSAGLKPADFAKTSNVHPGQWAVAAGNPRGLGADGKAIVTLGIVSGKGRVAGGTYRYDNAVQTDAEINPGNSGGPLFDLEGRVIGINGLISTLNNERVSVGVGYTIPGDQIQTFLPQLLSGDVVEPGYSGLVVDRKTHGEGGVLVKNVVRGSPASKVGLKQDDRIVGVNNTPIETYTDWANAVAMLPAGKSMSVRFVRDGRASMKRFTLARPEERQER